MNFRFQPARNFCKRLLSLDSNPLAGLFGLGVFLGIVAISLWEQWSLTFGLDPQLLLAVSLVVSLSFWWGSNPRNRRTASTGKSLSELILCLCAWSLLHPFWIETMTVVLANVSLVWFERADTKPLLSLTLAVVGWSVPAILWSSVIACGVSAARAAGRPIRQAFAIVFCGIASGLLLDSLGFAPRFGVFTPTIVAVTFAAGFGVRLRRFVFPEDRSTEAGDTLTSSPPRIEIVVRTGMACLVGGLLACNLRIVNQLMPHGSFVIYAQVAGLVTGIAAGLITSRRLAAADRAAWGGILAGAMGTGFLALQPTLIDASLWMNSSLTSVQLLLAARVLLMMSIPFPFGLALAWIADSSKDDSKPALVAWGMPLGLGLCVATFVLGGMADLISVMTLCSASLVASSGLMRVRSSGWKMPVRTAIGMGGLAAVALSTPRWQSCDDASRTAKLLYSTPTVLAYRFGWDVKHLPFLDDVRMIERREGSCGPLTLWRGRVADLFIRESGFPRAVISTNSDAVPQFAPEVLQAVYSMVICDRPNRVLCLGLSAGVPLSTCLNFPIREAVCTEGDSNLISLVQGPLARETGYDPLSDDRVTLQRINPELALLAKPAKPFDVILSSPPPSVLTSGSPQFTQEFYHRASDQLSERGLFCQRFECVDYGIQPVQLVLKAMREAFKQVIAIEPTPGELLLFASNSNDVFVPGELASRLETPHVSRILARTGLDWSALLNLPAFDHAALGEVCDESPRFANSAFKGQLAGLAPLEVMRWGNKQAEIQDALTATRITPAPFWYDAKGRSTLVEEELHLSRRSRLVEWLGDARLTQELLRRLGEVAEQQKLVRDNPDAHWWVYRKSLRKQLQEKPRTIVQVTATDDQQKIHPEDVRRKNYFIALGNAARQRRPTRDQIAAVERFLEPYDPLLSYFARQETAELLARSGEDAARELAYRLHVIYFAPTIDPSVRNVAKAVGTIVKHPEAIDDPSTRFDALNGLIQTLRVRWELRQSIRETSSRKILDDVDQSLIAIEQGLEAMDSLAESAGVAPGDWQIRKEVIERLMLRPLRSYRNEVHARQVRGQAQARAIIDEANRPTDDQAMPEGDDEE